MEGAQGVIVNRALPLRHIPEGSLRPALPRAGTAICHLAGGPIGEPGDWLAGLAPYFLESGGCA